MIFLKKKYLDREMNIFIFLWCFSFVMPIVGYFMGILDWLLFYGMANMELELKGGHRIKSIWGGDFFSGIFPKV